MILDGNHDEHNEVVAIHGYLMNKNPYIHDL